MHIVMSRRDQLILGSIFLITMICMQPAATSAKVEEVFFPKVQTTSAELVADRNNNLLVASEPYFNWLTAEFWANQPVSHYDYNLQNRNVRGVFAAEQRFSPGHPFLLQFDNTTADQTVVNFQTKY